MDEITTLRPSKANLFKHRNSSIKIQGGDTKTLRAEESRSKIIGSIQCKEKWVCINSENLEFYRSKANQCVSKEYRAGTFEYDYEAHETLLPDGKVELDQRDPPQSRVSTATGLNREKQL